ncbi:MAG: MBL fold metallo-hydrolase [Planctomycetota bacterium]
MRVQFWGAAGTVTGSMHLVEVSGRRILLDCGMYVGHRKQAFEINRNVPFDVRSIDAVVVSHAHIDHTGNLPTLVRAGYEGPIHATGATADLADYMLLDSAHIQESDVKYVNKGRARMGKRLFEPLYVQEDARQTLRQFVSHDYGKPFAPVPGVQVQFFDAGHILGSASVLLTSGEGNGARTLLFSGDIGRKDLPILRNPQIPPGVHAVIMESTYGNRVHESSDTTKEDLERIARETFERGGKLLIPCFAVGRAQDVLYRLNELWEERRLPVMDVFVDSPLAINITEVYQRHRECYDQDALDAARSEKDRDPLSFFESPLCANRWRTKAINDSGLVPAVVISASGMCESGRILHHLKNGIEDKRNTILFVGYQAEHTLGRRILDGAEFVSILGYDRKVRAKTERMEGFSAHADRNELLAWAAQVRSRGAVEKFFLVHGEDEAPRSLAQGLRDQGALQVTIPRRGDIHAI